MRAVLRVALTIKLGFIEYPWTLHDNVAAATITAACKLRLRLRSMVSIGVSKLYLQRNKKENAPQQLPSLFWIVVVSNITGATSRHYGHSTDSSLMDDVCELEWDQTFDGWSYHRQQIGRGQTKMVVPETYLE